MTTQLRQHLVRFNSITVRRTQAIKMKDWLRIYLLLMRLRYQYHQNCRIQTKVQLTREMQHLM
eukprot:9333284-Ditylum_brightwellii.AAC.1